MSLHARCFQPEDYWRIRAFLRALLPLNDYRQRCWDVVRFDYWLWHGVANLEHFNLPEVITLWEDQRGEIAAVLHPENPGEAFLEIHPALRSAELEEEMITLAEQRLARAHPDGSRSLCIWAPQGDALRVPLLEQRGYSPGSDVEYQRRRGLDAPIPVAPLPAGYIVRALGDGAELLERCYASGLAFHPDDIRYAVDNRSDVSWYHNIQNAPLYRRDLDLVALAPDGAVASFCTIWFDDINRTGVFEPVGTVPAHQRRGLGKAVMTEGLHRLKRMGARLAFVGSYSAAAGALYESVGFGDYELNQPWQRKWRN